MMNNKYNITNKALLVVDIQEDATGKTAKNPLPYKDSAELIANINSVIDVCKDKGILVVYIKHEINSNLLSRKLWGRFIAGTAGSEIDSRINIINNYIYSKNKGDAFSNAKLNRYLKENYIDEIFITGLDASACVLKTSLGAKKRGYGVIVLKDAITTMRMNKLPKLLEKYLKYGIEISSVEEFNKINNSVVKVY